MNLNSTTASLSNNQQRSFTIEGNIGCGKSTFLKIVKKYFPELELIEEPVDQWQNLAGKGINMLERYYKDSKRWGLTFLNLAAFTRVRRFLAKNGNTQIFTLSERSILSDKHIFGPLMSDLGFIDQAEYILFQEMYKGYEQMLQSSIPKVIYLQCSPQMCSERTKKRQRTQEQSIPFSYFQKLHDLHERWMREDNEKNMLVIDTNDQFESDPEKIDEMVEKLSLFIYGKQQLSASTSSSTSLDKLESETEPITHKQSSEDQ